MNAINVIWPYKHHGMWVFDDARVGLVQEPFVSKHRDGLGGPCNGWLPHGMGISRLTDLPTGMVPAARDAWPSVALTQHSNRVSANIGLRCRETLFCDAETRAPKRPLKSTRQNVETK
jgi:hypothetical protein